MSMIVAYDAMVNAIIGSHSDNAAKFQSIKSMPFIHTDLILFVFALNGSLFMIFFFLVDLEFQRFA